MPIQYYIYLCLALFSIGIIGVLTRRNAIIVFMCIELMLNAVNLLLVAFSKMHHGAAIAVNPASQTGVEGQLFVFFIMVVDQLHHKKRYSLTLKRLNNKSMMSQENLWDKMN